MPGTEYYGAALEAAVQPGAGQQATLNQMVSRHPDRDVPVQPVRQPADRHDQSQS